MPMTHHCSDALMTGIHISRIGQSEVLKQHAVYRAPVPAWLRPPCMPRPPLCGRFCRPQHWRRVWECSAIDLLIRAGRLCSLEPGRSLRTPAVRRLPPHVGNAAALTEFFLIRASRLINRPSGAVASSMTCFTPPHAPQQSL